MKIANNLVFLFASLLVIVSTTVAETNDKENSSLRGVGTSSSDTPKLLRNDSQDHRELGKTSFGVITSSKSGSKIAWRIFEKDSDPQLQDQYESIIKYVPVKSYLSTRWPVSLYDGVEYCFRVYKGTDASQYGNATGSNAIKLKSGSTTHYWGSFTKPGQYFKCFKTPGSPCLGGEETAIVYAIGTLDGDTTSEISDEAWEVSKDTELPGEFDGEQAQDAFRHCYFSCRLTQEIGSSQAKIAGDIHENCNFATLGARKKNQYNNKKGREFGVVGDADCTESCISAVELETLMIYE